MARAGKQAGRMSVDRVQALAAQYRNPDLLGIYLNDHLAGATGGTELARRVAKARRGRDGGAELARLAAEIEADRDALLEVMAELGVPHRRYKIWAGWLGEKAGRAKLNGRVLARSPLSDLLELELLRLGVEGKAAGWRTLHTMAATDERLEGVRLVNLIARARQQIDALEELRVQAAARLLRDGWGGGRDPRSSHVRG
jgi:hypothetical protein